MRILAIDLGTKNMGLAITDKSATIINALNNFAFAQNNFSACYQKIKSVVETYNNEIDTIVLGWPLMLNGTKNSWTELVEKFGKKLVKLYPNIKIILQDERMSTKKATGHLKESLQLKCSQIKKIKDKMSAYIILEEYLYTINKYKKEQ